MPFCPQCNYEYKEGIETCPDCKVELVAELPPKEQENDSTEDLDLVEIYSLPGLPYAEMVKEAFEKEGIDCMIKPDFLSTSHLARGVGVAGTSARVLVRKEHAEKAKQILHTMMDHF
jgi:hypothetical protein